MPHRLYTCIVCAIKNGSLSEPFSASDVKRVCPNFASSTYSNFLPKHRKGNPGSNSVLFEQDSNKKYKCVRPFLYGL
jgi:hypothetical protein